MVMYKDHFDNNVTNNFAFSHYNNDICKKFTTKLVERYKLLRHLQIYNPCCHAVDFFSLFLLRKGDNKEKEREAVGRQIKSLISSPDSREKKERMKFV